jgi:hypothetical protein
MKKYTKKTNKHRRITKRKVQSKNKKLNKSRIGKFNLSGGALDYTKLDKVLENFDGFVWDFDDTIANKVVHNNNNLHLSMNDVLIKKIKEGNPILNNHGIFKTFTIKDFFYEPDNFVDLVNYLVSNGKKVGIISFGYPDKILELLNLLFGENCPFNNTNIYGVDRNIKQSDAIQIRKKKKVNFMSEFMGKTLVPERILFFDDDYRNTFALSNLGYKAISLIGNKSRQAEFVPTTKIISDGFSVKILYLINKLLQKDPPIPFDSNLLFTSNQEIQSIDISSATNGNGSSKRSRQSSNEASEEELPVPPSQTGSTFKRSGAFKRQRPKISPSSSTAIYASVKPKTERVKTSNAPALPPRISQKNMVIPSRGWTNNDNSNETPPTPPPRSTRRIGQSNTLVRRQEIPTMEHKLHLLKQAINQDQQFRSKTERAPYINLGNNNPLSSVYRSSEA